MLAEIPAGPAGKPGDVFLRETREQPRALERLLEHDAEIARIGRLARERGATVVRMVGHGSPGQRGVVRCLCLRLVPRWTALRDSISLRVLYDAPLDMSMSTVLALSQPGRTPDVVEYVVRARRHPAEVA